MIGGGVIVLRLVCELTLAVDRSGEIVDEPRVRLVVLRRDRQHLRVGVLGPRVVGKVERPVCVVTTVSVRLLVSIGKISKVL